MKNFLLDIIVDPISKTALSYSQVENNFIATDGTVYDIVEGVPIFLKEMATTTIDTVNFDYQLHYQNDANHFNYFDEPHDVVFFERERNRQSIMNALPNSAKLILDIGCGNAWLASHLVGETVQVISADISLKNPMQALKAVTHKNHAALVADAFNLPFGENTIDAIVASEIMEHVVNPKIFIEKLLFCLKPNGKLILATPYDEAIVQNVCIHCNKITPSNAHLHSFNQKNLVNFLPFGITKIDSKKINNKYFNKLRIYKFLNFLPYKVWLSIDIIANFFFKKPTCFIIEISK